MIETARRYNTGKLRYELIPSNALKDLAEVYTKGGAKYSDFDEEGKMIYDGSYNWRKGMSWTSVIASVQRHIEQWKAGEEIDSDLGTKHLANAAWGLFTLLEYYKIAPQFDDRVRRPRFKIGLDIDEVLCDWISGYKRFYNYPEDHEFKSWYLHYDVIKHCTDDLGCEFYRSLSPLIKPEDIPFEPHCYIISRNLDSSITMEWLQRHGYPTRPVFTVGLKESKAEIAKREGVEIFVDDVYKNFCELNDAGVFCYLLDRPHNRRFNVGHKRIYSLKELV